MEERTLNCLDVAKFFCIHYRNIKKNAIKKFSGYEKYICEQIGNGIEIEKNKNYQRYRDCNINLNGGKSIGVELKKCKDSMQFDNVRYSEMVLEKNKYSKKYTTVVIFYSNDYEITEIAIIDTIKLIEKLFESTDFKTLRSYITQYEKSNHSIKGHTSITKKQLKNISSFIIKNEKVYGPNDETVYYFSKDDYSFYNNISRTKIENNVEIKQEKFLLDIGEKPNIHRNRKECFFKIKKKSGRKGYRIYSYNNGYRYIKMAWGKEYECQISYSDSGKPIFIVTDTESGKEYIGDSPTSPWTQICNYYNKKLNTNRLISGPLYFGLRDDKILNKIEVNVKV